MAKQHKSIDTEKAVLGLLISNYKVASQSIGYLQPEEFFDSKHKIIYSAIKKIVENGLKIEMAAIINELKTSGNFEKIGKEEYLAELIAASALESNLFGFIKVISEKAKLRYVKEVVTSLSKELDKSDADSNLLIEKVETEILASTRETEMRDFEHSKEIIKKTIEQIQKRMQGGSISGIPTEWDDFNEITSGFQKGDLIILAARPSMGKTAFALNISQSAARNNTIAFFSLEMPKEQLLARILSSTSYVDSYKFKKNNLSKQDWIKINQAEEEISNMNLFIDDTPGLTLSELMWKAKKLNQTKSIDIILVDYMQLIAGPKGSSGDNRQAEVSAISRGLKKLARELNVPVIALSQLSRRVEQREDKRPLMSDIRESGAIEQDADLIMFLYRDAYYNPKKNIEDKTEERHQITEVIISKHRNGATGKLELIFDPTIGLFQNKPKGEF
ncbi:MAG: replicative DNA helicase [Mycoplasma sp.]|nr:replicative DNA helicase [Mycoplasma sp.]